MPRTRSLIHPLLLASLVLFTTGHDFSAWSAGSKHYTPDWASLDSRPAPEWYDEAKIGIFIHWGVFSVPAFVSEWFWWYWKGDKPRGDVVDFMRANHRPGWTYADFARDFTAEFFDADQWAQLFNASGARYIVLTTKHHEGFTLWPSKSSFNWNAEAVGPKRDLVGELEQAVRSTGHLRFGLYHSLFEWFNEEWLADHENGFKTRTYALSKALPELYYIVNHYRPEIIWSDGDADAPDTYWNSTGFLAWLYNDSPVKDTVLVNDRWGVGTSCKHGDFYNCADRFKPGHTLPHKWENAFTLDKSSWGYRRTMRVGDVLTIEELLANIIETVALNGNALVNIGPRKDGTIPAIFEERLRQMGQWLTINGEAIYATRPWTSACEPEGSAIWYTWNAWTNSIYVHVTKWPVDNVLSLSNINSSVPVNTVSMLGMAERLLDFNITANRTRISMPILRGSAKWIWVLKLTLRTF